MSKVSCTRCGGRNTKYVKKWRMKSGRSEIELEIKLYHCRDCNKSFRIPKRIE